MQDLLHIIIGNCKATPKGPYLVGLYSSLLIVGGCFFKDFLGSNFNFCAQINLKIYNQLTTFIN